MKIAKFKMWFASREILCKIIAILIAALISTCLAKIAYCM
jgi:hypothetical protein